jgi:predicted RNA-binding Zn-ribbon protein involved in translation (DUF1610 family)
MEVISESRERDREVFYNGNRSTEPFQIEPDDDEYGFDMGGVYGGPGFILAPEEYVVGTWCPRCNAEITGQWIRFLRNEDGKRVEHQSSVVKMSCPKCGAVFRVDEAKSDAVDKFYMTDRFVNFWDCRPFKPEWVAEFGRQMGCRHETFDYGWT